MKPSSLILYLLIPLFPLYIIQVNCSHKKDAIRLEICEEYPNRDTIKEVINGDTVIRPAIQYPMGDDFTIPCWADGDYDSIMLRFKLAIDDTCSLYIIDDFENVIKVLTENAYHKMGFHFYGWKAEKKEEIYGARLLTTDYSKIHWFYVR